MRALPLLLLASAGCVAPGVYGSARTLEPGDHQWVLSLDLLQNTEGSFGDDRFYPRVSYRRGLTRRLEVGLQTAAYPTLGADLKVGIVRGEIVALAFAPTLSYSYRPDDGYGDGSWAELRLPVLVELALAEAWALSAATGLGTAVDLDRDLPDILVRGVAAGVRYQGDGFALHPTLGYFGALVDGRELGWVSAGIAVTLGEMAARR